MYDGVVTAGQHARGVSPQPPRRTRKEERAAKRREKLRAKRLKEEEARRHAILNRNRHLDPLHPNAPKHKRSTAGATRIRKALTALLVAGSVGAVVFASLRGADIGRKISKTPSIETSIAPSIEGADIANISWPKSTAEIAVHKSYSRVLAGGVEENGNGDRNNTAVLLRPTAIAEGAMGIYVVDEGAQELRLLGTDGKVRSLNIGIDPLGASRPKAVATLPSGQVVVALSNPSRLMLLDGTKRTPLNAPGLVDPVAMTADSKGNVYIADPGARNVWKLTASGIVAVVEPGVLAGPTGVALDKDGTLYVADPALGIVGKVDTNGAFSTLAAMTNRQADFPLALPIDEAPVAVAVVDTDVLVVGAQSRLYRIVPGGDDVLSPPEVKLVTEALQFPTAIISTRNNRYLVVDGGSQRVLSFDQRNENRAVVERPQQDRVPDRTATDAIDVRLLEPTSAAAAPNGDIIVSDRSAQLVWAISPDGSARVLAGNSQKGAALFGGPANEVAAQDPGSVAVDADGSVYFVEEETGRIRVVRSDGNINLAYPLPADAPDADSVNRAMLEAGRRISLDRFLPGLIGVGRGTSLFAVDRRDGTVALVNNGVIRILGVVGPASAMAVTSTDEVLIATLDGNIHRVVAGSDAVIGTYEPVDSEAFPGGRKPLLSAGNAGTVYVQNVASASSSDKRFSFVTAPVFGDTPEAQAAIAAASASVSSRTAQLASSVPFALLRDGSSLAFGRRGQVLSRTTSDGFFTQTSVLASPTPRNIVGSLADEAVLAGLQTMAVGLDDTVVLARDNQIVTIRDSTVRQSTGDGRMTVTADPNDQLNLALRSVDHLSTDIDGNIYAGTADGLLTIKADGAATLQPSPSGGPRELLSRTADGDVFGRVGGVWQTNTQTKGASLPSGVGTLPTLRSLEMLSDGRAIALTEEGSAILVTAKEQKKLSLPKDFQPTHLTVDRSDVVSLLDSSTNQIVQIGPFGLRRIDLGAVGRVDNARQPGRAPNYTAISAMKDGSIALVDQATATIVLVRSNEQR